MADTITTKEYTGDGSDLTWAYTFQSYQKEDIKVAVTDSSGTFVIVDNYTIPDYSTASGTVTFDNTTGTTNTNVCESSGAPTNGRTIRIYRNTDITTGSVGEYDPKATYTAGSAVKATDLNNNAKQALYAAFELKDQQLLTSSLRNSSVTTAKIANNAITNAKIADNSIDSEHYVDGSIDHVHLANDVIDGDNIQDDVINSEHIVAGAVDLEHMSANSVDSDQYVDGSIDTIHIADNQVTVGKIADAELKTLAGMQSGTASILASGTALSSTTTELNMLDGKSIVTTIATNATDVQLPTAQAVNERVVTVMQDTGGFVPIANEVSFPNTNPDPNDDAGTIVSIADAGGIVVNGSGVSTTGRTLGGATVTINSIDSSLNNTTITAGQGMLVETTSTLNTYTYHRLVIDAPGVQSAKAAIDDFNNRYRVGNTNPTSSLDDGDLFFNTTSDKMLVYNATGSSWDEVQSVGNFFINTISSYSGTGGNSAAFNGSAYRFVLSNPGSSAEQHIVSVNGVIQKPNSGTSQPAEGFAIDGSSILFSSAPASGSDYFIITIGAAVNIGTPSNNTVTTAIIQNLAVTTDKIANDAVTYAKMQDVSATDRILGRDSAGAGIVEEITPANLRTMINVEDGATADQTNAEIRTAVEAASDSNVFTDADHTKLNAIAASANNYTHPNHTGDVTSSGDGATTIANDAVTGAKIADNAIDSEHYTDGSIDHVHLAADAVDGDNIADDSINSEHYVDGSIDTAHIAADQITGALIADDAVGAEHIEVLDAALQFGDSVKAQFGAGNDLEIWHDSNNNSYITESGSGSLVIKADDFYVQLPNSNNLMRVGEDEKVELFHDGSKKFETNSTGVKLSGNLQLDLGSGNDGYIYNASAGGLVFQADDNGHTFQTYASSAWHTRLTITDGGNVRVPDSGKFTAGTSDDLQIYHDGTNSWISNVTGDIEISNIHNNSDDIWIRTTDDCGIQVNKTENAIICNANGSVDLYYDNSKKLATQSIGITVTGQVACDELNLADSTGSGNNRIKCGTGDDLEIYHDGTNSYLTNSTGMLIADTSQSAIGLRVSNSAHDAQLQILATAANKNSSIFFGDAGDGNVGHIDYDHNDNNLNFRVNSAERMRIDSSGRLLVGTDTAMTTGSNDLRDTIQAVHTAGAQLLLARNDTGTANTNRIGEIAALGNDSNGTYQVGATIRFEADSAHGNDDKPTAILFKTCPNGSATLSERMRIASDGKVGIGTGASPDETFHVQGYVSAFERTDVNSGTHERVCGFKDGGGTERGNIKVSNASVQFNTTSDYRLKENQTSITDGITRLKTLKPYQFNFKQNPDVKVDGFFAHEVTAVPEAVSGTKDQVVVQADVDKGEYPESKLGDPIHQGIDQSKLVPLLTAALQEAITKIETLETKVAALEAK